MALLWVVSISATLHLVVQSLSRVQLLRSHGWQLTRVLCPWDSPGQNTAVGCHSLLQGIFLTQGSNLGLLHCRQILYPLSHQGSPVTSITQVLSREGSKWGIEMDSESSLQPAQQTRLSPPSLLPQTLAFETLSDLTQRRPSVTPCDLLSVRNVHSELSLSPPCS